MEAGTELDTGYDGYVPVDVGSVGGVFTSVFGSDPPDRKEGHSERSSGREVPVADGERCDKIAAA